MHLILNGPHRIPPKSGVFCSTTLCFLDVHDRWKRFMRQPLRHEYSWIGSINQLSRPVPFVHFSPASNTSMPQAGSTMVLPSQSSPFAQAIEVNIFCPRPLSTDANKQTALAYAVVLMVLDFFGFPMFNSSRSNVRKVNPWFHSWSTLSNVSLFLQLLSLKFIYALRLNFHRASGHDSGEMTYISIFTSNKQSRTGWSTHFTRTRQLYILFNRFPGPPVYFMIAACILKRYWETHYCLFHLSPNCLCIFISLLTFHVLFAY